MQTSRAKLDRLLDPENELGTLAWAACGREAASVGFGVSYRASSNVEEQPFLAALRPDESTATDRAGSCP